MLITLANAILQGKIVRATKDGIHIADENVIFELSGDAGSSASSGTEAFHPFRAYIAPLADCNDQSKFGYVIQVRAGLIEYRDPNYLGNAIDGPFNTGALITSLRPYPCLFCSAGADGVVGTSGAYPRDYSTATTAGPTREEVIMDDTTDWTAAGAAQFVFTEDIVDGYNRGAIFAQITAAPDDTTPPTVEIVARHYGGAPRQSDPWPTGLVIPIARLEFPNDAEFTDTIVENLQFGHAISGSPHAAPRTVWRGEWDNTQWFYNGDIVKHEINSVGVDYTLWLAKVDNQNIEPSIPNAGTWEPVEHI